MILENFSTQWIQFPRLNIDDDDMNKYTVITKFMENGCIKEAIEEYLKNTNSKNEINPTIRSKIIFGVASTMKKLHAQEIYNIDLSHDNIYLDEKFEPQINIFHTSRLILNGIDYEKRSKDSYYVAPEVFNDFENYDMKSDVYSFAIFLYKMFSTTISLGNKNIIIHHIMNNIRPSKPHNISDNYWELIQKCWDNNPNYRPTFNEIVDILKEEEYSINEFGMKTDTDELHEYQERIENESFLNQNN